MTGGNRSSIRQRRVSAELRRLREARGMSCEEVAHALGCSVSKISRMETGVRGLNVDDVATILGVLHVPAKLREELLGLVRNSAERNVVQIHGKLPEPLKDLIRAENEAAALYNYESLLVPGLLQTGDYARTVIRAGDPTLPELEVDELVTNRMARQALLSRTRGPTLTVIIDEMVLRRPIGAPGVQAGQLQHLLAMSQRPKVELRVVPFATRQHPGLGGPLMILDFDDQPTLVSFDARSISGLLEEEPVIKRARLTWRGLLAVALSAEDSARLIAEIAGELT
ncbi:transcriptional regulator with XRE-family HTH domain [Tamaricihabitans halophyticus]|uniref:Transcriptional regulator with XRE-family HTH domain n=1 Tax=Tamaricihabitans halophyticus TaxID=1262583 RepID=A0A4R2R287_9PSEU|nr:helix-turn-helix transcriptional regulator [Tamaricihabitans halophyticus]TCP56832.1 transcriptional regulator with XRE-family HTH domain [Tamaricihabitans halophyticus]